MKVGDRIPCVFDNCVSECECASSLLPVWESIYKRVSNQLMFFILRQTHEDQENSKVVGDFRKQVPVLDKEKNIAFLLKELDSLRDLNKKVNSELLKVGYS